MTQHSRNTDMDWDYIAKSSPYWGVLSQDKYRGNELMGPEWESFFQSGSDYVDNLTGFVVKHLKPQARFRLAVDFGCGVGRLALALSKCADSVIGLDVSPRMVELCNDNAMRFGVANVRAIVSDDELTVLEEGYDFLNSLIVLQHIPPPRGLRLIQILLAKLALGGIASLQLTYCKERRHIQHEIGSARYYRREGRQITDVTGAASQPPLGTITMFDYDLNEIFAIVSEVAGHPLLVLPTNDDGHLGVHLIFEKARHSPI